MPLLRSFLASATSDGSTVSRYYADGFFHTEQTFDTTVGDKVHISSTQTGVVGQLGYDIDYSGVVPTPTPTTSPSVFNDDILTIIKNQTVVLNPTIQPIITYTPFAHSTETNQLLQTIMPQGNAGEHFNLVGTTDGVTPVQTVSMEQLQSASGGQGINEIRVPLGQDSFVELINGGVNLPLGLSQEFYVINNTNSEKKN